MRAVNMRCTRVSTTLCKVSQKCHKVRIRPGNLAQCYGGDRKSVTKCPKQPVQCPKTRVERGFSAQCYGGAEKCPKVAKYTVRRSRSRGPVHVRVNVCSYVNTDADTGCERQSVKRKQLHRPVSSSGRERNPLPLLSGQRRCNGLRPASQIDTAHLTPGSASDLSGDARSRGNFKIRRPAMPISKPDCRTIL